MSNVSTKQIEYIRDNYMKETPSVMGFKLKITRGQVMAACKFLGVIPLSDPDEVKIKGKHLLEKAVVPDVFKKQKRFPAVYTNRKSIFEDGFYDDVLKNIKDE